MKRAAFSLVFNSLNLIINLIPSILIIPILTDISGNEGLSKWNLFLVLIAVFQLIVDYGLSTNAPALIKKNKDYVYYILKFRIKGLAVAFFSILAISYLGVLKDIGFLYIFFCVAAYSLNPIWFYQATNKTIIPLSLNTVTVIAFLIASFSGLLLTIDEFLLAFTFRIAVVSMFLWIHIAFSEKIKMFTSSYPSRQINVLKNNFSIFKSSLLIAFINTGYILWVSLFLSLDQFATYSLTHKLAMVGVMFVGSYCNTYLLSNKNSSYFEIFVVLCGAAFSILILLILDLLGVTVAETEKLALRLQGVFFVLYGLFTIRYYKMIHSENSDLNKLGNLIFILIALLLILDIFVELSFFMYAMYPIVFSAVMLTYSEFCIRKNSLKSHDC